MRKNRWVLGLIAFVMAAGSLLAPPAGASPGNAGVEQASLAVTGIRTYTTKEAWLRQCVDLTCGYHVLPVSTPVTVYCYSDNVGIRWNLARTDGNLAGHLDASAVPDPQRTQSCANVGTKLFQRNSDLWAHSCPLMACGYGVVPPRNDTALVLEGVASDGADWSLILDHDNVRPNLAGWVHTADIDH